GSSDRTRRTPRLREECPARALGRHAAARVDLPRADPRSLAAPDGRAVRRPRRHDPRGAGHGAPAGVERASQNGRVRDPQHSRGDLAGGSGRGDGKQAGPHHRERADPVAAPSHHRDAVRAGFRTVQHGDQGRDRGRPRGRHVTERAATRWAREYALPAIAIAGLIGLWELFCRAARIPVWLLPSPVAIVRDTWQWADRIPGHLWVTFYEIIGGFAVAVLVGVPIAVAIVYSPLLRRIVYPILIVVQSVPKVALAPLFLIWVGYGPRSNILVAAIVAFFPMVVNTATG